MTELGKLLAPERAGRRRVDVGLTGTVGPEQGRKAVTSARVGIVREAPGESDALVDEEGVLDAPRGVVGNVLLPVADLLPAPELRQRDSSGQPTALGRASEATRETHHGNKLHRTGERVDLPGRPGVVPRVAERLGPGLGLVRLAVGPGKADLLDRAVVGNDSGGGGGL